MTSASTNPGVNIEAQRDTLQLHDLGETSDMKDYPIEMTDVAGRALVQPVVSPPTLGSEHKADEADGHPSKRAVAGGETPTRPEQQEIDTVARTRATPGVGYDSARINNATPIDGGPHGANSSREQEGRHMIGDFDGSANALWSLYGKEAKSNDESRVQTLKDDMDGVLIFAGLYSAVLTSFIIDSKQNLQASPSDQMVYYIQQNVALLAQISQQISFVVPQFSIPSTSPPPFPAFSPSATDVRVNAFWFMALTFSLSAALIAILVQQWVRDYMHVFQRYGDPLKSARIRQYLYEGSEGWYMPVIAEAVPGLLHVSLFLFFVGLADFILDINTAVGLSTTIPIGISGALYIFTTFAPILYPQSPYQNSFSGVIWYIVQKSKLFGRRFKDRDGKSKFVSTNMAQGQMQLAMEETKERQGRDVEAIRWLVDNLTEDGEVESFAMAIPGSFNGGWSLEVWEKVSKLTEEEKKAEWNELVPGSPSHLPLHAELPVSTQRPTGIRSVPSPFGAIVRLVGIHTTTHFPTDTMATLPARDSLDIHHVAIPSSVHVYELSKRMAHLFETCKNRGTFATEELWRRRTRACVEATALLISCADAKFIWFGDILRMLRDIGDFENTRGSSLLGRDQSFVMRWTCLSAIAIRSMLSGNKLIQEDARLAIASYKSFREGDGPEDEVAEKNAEAIDETLKNAWWLVLREYCRREAGSPKILESLPDNVDQISVGNVFANAAELQLVDSKISILQERIHEDGFNITRKFPGIQFYDLNSQDNMETPNLLDDLLSAPFTFFDRILRTFEWHYADSFSYGSYAMKDKGGVADWALSLQGKLKNPLQRQLWRLQDLRDGGGLGFTVELFFLALKQLLSTSTSQDAHSVLCIGTFRAITSDWPRYKRSLGTQKLLLDIVASEQGFVHQFNYPTYITDELLALLNHILEGQTGPHIDKAVEQLSSPLSRPTNRPGIQEFRTKAWQVISTRSSWPR